MANLTLSVNDDLLKKARLRALDQGTSVNAVLRDFLTSYVGIDQIRREAVMDLIKLSAESQSRRGGRTWRREELYDR